MINDKEYGFLFKPNGNTDQGPSDAGEENFNGSSVARALARELGQNSLDAIAREDGWPVRMEFELRRMPVKDIPDVDSLRRHLMASLDSYGDSPRLRHAVEALDGEEISVLRVGDYGTKGLEGGESILDASSTLNALTRGSGVSVGKTDAGGSFGIGKAVGLLASRIRTEFWTTRTRSSDTTVFAGCCQLTTHHNPASDSPLDRLGPMGTYTRLDDGTDYHYLRSPGPLGPFGERVEPGTDVYIMGYVDADEDPRLERVRDALIDNFMAAIMRGHLVAVGVNDDGEVWTLDRDHLKQAIDSITDRDVRTELNAFHNALLQEPVVTTDPLLGEMRLYINIDDQLPRRLNTVAMRRPLMKVCTFEHRSIPVRYAAVLECSSPQGNRILRDMEPVQHNKWIESKRPEGRKVLKAIKTFIRDELRRRVGQELGEEIRIKGLNTLLPAGLSFDGDMSPRGGRPTNGPGTIKESASTQGAEQHAQPATEDKPQSVRVSLMEPAVATGDGDQASTGRKRGGTATRGRHSAGLPAAGTPGDGGSIIPAGALSMRYWYEASTGGYILVLRSRDGHGTTGGLRLTAAVNGEFGDYMPPVTSAELLDPNGAHPLEIDNGTIRGVTVSGTHPTRLRVRVASGARLQLGVK